MPLYDFAGNTAPSDRLPQRQPQPYGQPPQNYNWGELPPHQQQAGPIPFDLSDDWSGWRTNNWALQYDTLPWLRDSILFARKMQPTQQNAIMALVQALQNPAGQSAAFRGQQMGQAREQGRRLGQALAMQGGGNAASLRQGAMLDAMNHGADASSSYDAYLQSPKGQQEALQAIVQAIQMASNPEALNTYQGITGTTLGTEDLRLKLDQLNAHKGGGLGGILGSVLGGLTGGGWSSIIGALSGLGLGGGSSWENARDAGGSPPEGGLNELRQR